MQYTKPFISPSAVVSLSILDQTTFENDSLCDKTRIQVVVRSNETNTTHPNVISVPTQRIPASLFRDISSSSNIEAHQGASIYYRTQEVDNQSESGHHPIIYAVESIFSRKLGVSDALERGNISFRASLRVIERGVSYYPELTSGEVYEDIVMANIIVVITKGIEMFPINTSSYSHILWTEVNNFLSTSRERDPLEIGLDPIDYCIHGLCISTTYNVLARSFGIDLYPH